MTDPIDLTTLANVKLYLGAAAVPVTLEPLVQLLITAASQWVATYCNRTFQSKAYTETYDGTGTQMLMLRQVPVTAVASVEVGRVPWVTAVGTDIQGYEFDASTLYAVNGIWFPYRKRAVVVSYTAGFATTPADLEQAVTEMVALKLTQRTQIGISARSIANETISYTTADAPKSAKSVFDSYQRAAPL